MGKRLKAKQHPHTHHARKPAPVPSSATAAITGYSWKPSAYLPSQITATAASFATFVSSYLPTVNAMPTHLQEQMRSTVNHTLTNITNWITTNSTTYCTPENAKERASECYAYINNAAEAAIDIALKMKDPDNDDTPDSQSLYNCMKDVIRDNLSTWLATYSPDPQALTQICSTSFERQAAGSVGGLSYSTNDKIVVEVKAMTDFTQTICDAFIKQVKNDVDTCEHDPNFDALIEGLTITAIVVASAIGVCAVGAGIKTAVEYYNSNGSKQEKQLLLTN